MKFRGLITDQTAMKEFMNIVISFSKLSKECILRLTEDKIYFIITDEDHGPRKPYVWCELSTNYYFRDYNMSGVSEESNEIYLSFSPSMLAKCVTSIKQGAKSFKMKLTNKQTPCLTLEIDMAMIETTKSRECVHDIPVEIITRKYWGDFKEPTYEEFHVSLQLPSIKPIRNMVERMKTMSQYLIISASKTGRVTLKMEASLVNVSAHFHNLTVHSFAEGLDCFTDTQADTDVTNIDEPNDARNQVVSVSIDVRKLVGFVSALHIVSNNIICSIVHENMAKFSIENANHMKLQCFLTEYSN